MSDELKPLPCPFCGGENFGYEEGSTFRWMNLYCGDCGASMEVKKADTGLECNSPVNTKRVIAAWNTRATLPQDTQAHGECDAGQDVPAEVDIASLSYARSIIAMAAELGKGRDVAVMAKIQCAFIHAIQTFATQSSSVRGECDAGQKRVDETNTSAKHVHISDNNEHIPQSSSVREREPVAWMTRKKPNGLMRNCYALPPQDYQVSLAISRGEEYVPLYTTPPDTQDIRQQAMNDAYERAAKVCDGNVAHHMLLGSLVEENVARDCGTEIRALIGKMGDA